MKQAYGGLRFPDHTLFYRSSQKVHYSHSTKDPGSEWRPARVTVAVASVKILHVTELFPTICPFNYHNNLRRRISPDERVEVQGNRDERMEAEQLAQIPQFFRNQSWTPAQAV